MLHKGKTKFPIKKDGITINETCAPVLLIVNSNPFFMGWLHIWEINKKPNWVGIRVVFWLWLIHQNNQQIIVGFIVLVVACAAYETPQGLIYWHCRASFCPSSQRLTPVFSQIGTAIAPRTDRPTSADCSAFCSPFPPSPFFTSSSSCPLVQHQAKAG